MSNATKDEKPKRVRRKVTIEPIQLDAAQAAQRMNVSLSHFHEHIRPLLPVVDLRPAGSKKPMLRWLVADIDALIETRRKEVA